MKDKIITIKPKNITQKQWVNFILELNLMKKAWKPYGVDVEIKAPGIKKTILWGNKIEKDRRPNNASRYSLYVKL